jgi:hypothetical protein
MLSRVGFSDHHVLHAASAAAQERGGGVSLPDGADWLDATSELRKAFIQHPELDPSLAAG